MKYFQLIATAFLVAVICIETGYGIKCYVCNSHQQQNCQDAFDNTTHKLQECGEGYDRCRKIVQELESDNKEWETRYIRQCAMGGLLGKENRPCKDRIGTSGVKMRYCHCQDGDGCNTASSVNLPISLMIGTVVGQFLWQKL